MRQRRDGFIHRWMSGSRYRAVSRAALRGAGRAWHDLRFKDLYQSGKEFELMHRARPDTSGLPAGPWHKIWRQAV